MMDSLVIVAQLTDRSSSPTENSSGGIDRMSQVACASLAINTFRFSVELLIRLKQKS